MLKRLMTIGLLALASLPAQAEIFKCTDAAGHVMYSNVASKGCTKMNLEPISTIPAGSKAAPKTPCMSLVQSLAIAWRLQSREHEGL